MRDFVKTDLIFLTLAGSHMYGTNTAESDIDKRGVCVPPKNVVMGFARNFEQQDIAGEDTTIYGLTKFLKLAADVNPNIIELLFAPEDCVQINHPTWKELLKYRDKFLSAEAYFTFCGYAHGQLKRIKTHRGWLLNPPNKKPLRSDYGLIETGLGIRELVKGLDLVELDPQAIKIVEQEKTYKSALAEWNQYQTWKANRNPKRAELEKKFGYDSKHAMHLIRLLLQAKEILTTGFLTVKRKDASFLLDIRAGKFTYDELIKESDNLQQELKNIIDNHKYIIPDKTNKLFLSDLCVELYELHWKLNG